MSVDVSVVIPVRNAVDTVGEALASVLSQHGPTLEVYVVDDGSSDGTAAQVARVAEIDPRVHLVERPPRGIVSALNDGVARARGRYIARMDADDVSLPARFAQQVALLDADPTLAAAGTLVEGFVDGGGVLGEGLARYIRWMNALLTPEDHARERFVESPLCHPSVMMRRDALLAVGGYIDTSWAEDYDLWLRFVSAGWRLAKVAMLGLRWRHRAGRLTFTDPRYTLPRFHAARARYLAPWLRAERRMRVVWGAGQTGKRFARALEGEGVTTEAFADIDPRKIGGVARGVSIVSHAVLNRDEHVVVVAVGARGARALIRAELAARGFVEGHDFVCVS